MFEKGNEWSEIGRKARKARGLGQPTRRHFVAAVDLGDAQKTLVNLRIGKDGAEITRRYGKRRFKLSLQQAVQAVARAALREYAEETLYRGRSVSRSPSTRRAAGSGGSTTTS